MSKSLFNTWDCKYCRHLKRSGLRLYCEVKANDRYVGWGRIPSEAYVWPWNECTATFFHPNDL